MLNPISSRNHPFELFFGIRRDMLSASTYLLEKLMYIKIFHHFCHIENWRYSRFFNLIVRICLDWTSQNSWCTSRILSNMSMRTSHLFKFQKLAQSDGFEKISDSPKLPNGNLRGSRKLSNRDGFIDLDAFWKLIRFESKIEFLVLSAPPAALKTPKQVKARKTVFWPLLASLGLCEKQPFRNKN